MDCTTNNKLNKDINNNNNSLINNNLNNNNNKINILNNSNNNNKLQFSNKSLSNNMITTINSNNNIHNKSLNQVLNLVDTQDLITVDIINKLLSSHLQSLTTLLHWVDSSVLVVDMDNMLNKSDLSIHLIVQLLINLLYNNNKSSSSH
ncbi:predicted protein [Candida tropicalis MYA-3404]|uniref:Uncharacterized protein n=1 Tax=Candida tropicalis (strain ATCC MYA-3404 / T1) TaxID=294747 RepID=C5M2B9_CANTT|nr:predicted protein [Candida tropicalis MYA-3404]EER35468.1 predicted protein [Candida tropicalis MYA-3404]KAG4409575.1 hypothetical protein JTP64_000213 [Candida tropicalis]